MAIEDLQKKANQLSAVLVEGAREPVKLALIVEAIRQVIREVADQDRRMQELRGNNGSPATGQNPGKF